jgi:hypothetical protein
MNEFIDISFLSSRCIDSAIAGLEEAKNPAGELFRLIQIRLATPSLEKISPAVNANCFGKHQVSDVAKKVAVDESPIQVP